MKPRPRNPLVAGIAILLLACMVGWLLTRNAVQPEQPQKTLPTGRVSKVNEKLVGTARQLALLADTPAEQDLAQRAARLCDQEVELDFATALRAAAAAPPPTNGPLHDLAAHVADFKQRVAATQQEVAQLTKDATGNSAAALKLELANAKLTYEQDELEDAQQDLMKAGGDQRGSVLRAQQELEASRQGALRLGKLVEGTPGALREQVALWFALESRHSQVEMASKEAKDEADKLAREHQGLEGNVGKAPEAEPGGDDGSADDTATVVAQLRRLSDQRKTMSDLDKRAQLCKELAAVYGKWLSVLSGRERTALHALTGSCGIILAILLAAVVVRAFLGRILARQADRRRVHQLRVVTRIAIHTVTAILILLVIFGAPTQMPTILGLAGAGLTVVLKDFIVSFFGWFVLMGRHGIRLGDWVEINGVGGEVIEIGVLKTVLLEMGNWTVTGHPTGRHVSFVNSFAIEGHYFNFSTAGQWLWDEIQVTLPPGGEPYQAAEQIRQMVERETAEEAKMAEQEWERITHQYGTRPFSAKPAADMRPGATGLVVNIRYITHAPQRYEVKSRLFQGIVELMHKADRLASA